MIEKVCDTLDRNFTILKIYKNSRLLFNRYYRLRLEIYEKRAFVSFVVRSSRIYRMVILRYKIDIDINKL